MSQFYDNASLVVIPSGYKAGTVYAQKPLTTDGQLAFTRTGDTATRVNSAGLIEKVRTNLFLQSEAFNVTWSKSAGITLTSGQTDPFGGTDAFLVSFNTTLGNSISQSLSVVSGVKYTMSAYIKGVDLTGLRMIVAGNSSASVMSQVINGTWVRVVITGTAATTGSLTNQIARSDNTLDQSFYIYGAQIETGDVATDYIPTTTAAVSVGPVANVPRLDYLGSTCGKLLLEPQRTNLVTYSEQLDNAAWTKNEITLTANFATSPDGYTNADRAMETSADAYHDILGSFSATSGTVYTASCFVKSAGQNFIYIYISTGTAAAVKFNLSTGTVIGTALGTVVGSKITNYGNGWYRCEVSYTAGATTTATISVSTTNSTALSLAPYIGDPTKGILVYGYQVEAGAYATSLIPTLAASATRGADACSKTGISSLIGQTEGTLFAEFTIGRTPASTDRVAILSDGTGNERIGISLGAAGLLYMFVVDGNATQAEIIRTGTTAGTYKVAAAYKANDFVFYVNGVQVGTDTAGTIPSCSRLDIGNQLGVGQLGGGVNQALLFPTRLTNAELAELTTL